MPHSFGSRTVKLAVGGQPSSPYHQLQTYAVLILHQALIVSADRYQEHKTIDIFEAVYPFLPLGSLAADIKHPIGQLAKVENRFCDTGRL